MSVIYGAAIHRQPLERMTVVDCQKGRGAKKQFADFLQNEFGSGRVAIKQYGKRWYVQTEHASEADVRRAAAILAPSDAKRVKMTHAPAA